MARGSAAASAGSIPLRRGLDRQEESIWRAGTTPTGERRPSALEDFHFREKIFHFDHERIPERVVHARGYGAHGYFENTSR